MRKFTPYIKLSKRKRRELDAMRRRTWQGFDPVTRRTKKPGAYDRARAKKNKIETETD